MREAINAVSDNELLHMFGESLEHAKEEEEIEQKIELVEDLFYYGELRKIFIEIKQRFGDRKADSRTRSEIESIFTDRHRKLITSTRLVWSIDAQKNSWDMFCRELRCGLYLNPVIGRNRK